MSASPLILLATAFIVLLAAYHLLSSGSRVPQGARLPKGPPQKPLIGNLTDIPPKHSWLQFFEWSKTYGPLYRLNIAGREHFIVSTEKVANDLLRERGNIYSSREQSPAAAVLLSDNLRPLFWPHNDVFRQGRKLMHQLCMPSAAATYEPTQILESTRLVHDLINNPADYEQWFRRYSAGLMFRLGFGRVMQDRDDPLLKRLFTEIHHIERVASPGAYLVDTFPVLMYLPDWLAPFKRELKALHAEELDIMRGLLNQTRRQMRADEAPPCWEKTYLETADDYGLTEDQGAYVVGTLFEAGADTTAAAMMSFMLAMAHHPEELKKLQRELDEVVGDQRLPVFTDIPQLPRVRAVAKETLRWRPVTAGGIPHFSTKDDIYQMGNETLFIPQGTNIHPNQWAIHREESLYPDPDVFKPERWTDPGWPTFREPLSQYLNLKNFSAFGFGRRICPGMHIAERSLFILIARVAWACDISKKKASDGKIVEVPLYDYTAGFNVQPKWFQFDLKPRSEERRRTVERERSEAMASDPLRKSPVSI